MNRKPNVASCLIGPQVILSARISTFLATVPLWDVALHAKEAAPPNPSPAIVFRVLEQRRIEVDERAVVLSRVAPPTLPIELPAPAPLTAREIAAADAFEAAHPQKKTAIIFLSATVYGRKVTAISFFGSQGKGAIFSNIDFNLFDGFGSFETADTVYSLMLAVSNQSAEDAAARNRELAEEGAEMAGQRIPQPEEFSPARSECLVVEDAAHQAPTVEQLAALNALHVFFDANKERLAESHIQREAVRAEEARLAQEHPPVPPDIVIHYWKSNPAPTAAPTEEPSK